MRVLVTGGTGSVGKAVVERLVGRGWGVRVVGRRLDLAIPGAEYAACDITDFQSLRDRARGCDAIVHLAAIAQPANAPGPEVFRVNALGTYNVFEAAAKEAIRRVVQASSINAFGCAYSLQEIPVEYFPIDEEHPTFTTDPYSYSKTVVEDIGRYYWRRDGITSAALRLPWVYAGDQLRSGRHAERVRRGRAVLDELLAMPPGERQQRLAEVRRRELEYRRQRPMEYEARQRDGRANARGDDPLRRMYGSDRFNFWAFVDERDSAQAFEKSLTADLEGSHVLFINDSHNWLLYDTEKLLGLFFPEVSRRKHPVRGTESLVSIRAARGLIGFEPEYSVARVLEASPE
jgi:nucleoside-diphosphate-sugar epimerase